MSIDGYMVLHLVHAATIFQSAQRLLNESTADVWAELRGWWVYNYLRPLEVITHDAGTNFASREFQSNCGFLQIEVNSTPFEAPQSMTTVERQHASLRKVFDTISHASPPTSEEITNLDLEARRFDVILRMTCKAVNDTVGTDGLVPTFLVFSNMPRPHITLGTSSKTNLERAKVRKATDDLSLAFSRRQVRMAMRTRHTPDASATGNMPLGSLEIIYCIRLKAWDGLYNVVRIRGDKVTLLCPEPAGPTNFEINDGPAVHNRPSFTPSIGGDNQKDIMTGYHFWEPGTRSPCTDTNN